MVTQFTKPTLHCVMDWYKRTFDVDQFRKSPWTWVITRPWDYNLLHTSRILNDDSPLKVAAVDLLKYTSCTDISSVFFSFFMCVCCFLKVLWWYWVVHFLPKLGNQVVGSPYLSQTSPLLLPHRTAVNIISKNGLMAVNCSQKLKVGKCSLPQRGAWLFVVVSWLCWI